MRVMVFKEGRLADRINGTDREATPGLIGFFLELELSSGLILIDIDIQNFWLSMAL